MGDLGRVREACRDPFEFSSSPLYRSLRETVASDDSLLQLAARGRAGQHPLLLLFGAVHLLLLGGADHELATYYPSITPKPGDISDAGPALSSFCAQYRDELVAQLETRLVQTSHVQRSLSLRYGLAHLARSVSEPVHIIEVGASVGLNLRFDRYCFDVGDRVFGELSSRVRIVSEWCGTEPPPNLDLLPPIASAVGIDLNPIDPRDEDARRWLHALVWPENADQRTLLANALSVVAADPPTIHAGDAIDLCPSIARSLPSGAPRLAFHCATRIHVPADRGAEFDDAVDSLGDSGPLYVLSQEHGYQRPAGAPAARRDGVALRLRTPDGVLMDLAAVEGHLRWIEPLVP